MDFGLIFEIENSEERNGSENIQLNSHDMKKDVDEDPVAYFF